MDKYDVKIEKFEDEELVVANPVFFDEDEFVDKMKEDGVKIIPGTYTKKYIRIMNTTGVVCDEPLMLEHKDKQGNIEMHSYRYLPKNKY